MNWGHAVSRDLMTWRHLPVFRQPSQNLYALSAGGGAFSGSALVEGDSAQFLHDGADADLWSHGRLS